MYSSTERKTLNKIYNMKIKWSVTSNKLDWATSFVQKLGKISTRATLGIYLGDYGYAWYDADPDIDLKEPIFKDLIDLRKWSGRAVDTPIGRKTLALAYSLIAEILFTPVLVSEDSFKAIIRVENIAVFLFIDFNSGKFAVRACTSDEKAAHPEGGYDHTIYSNHPTTNVNMPSVLNHNCGWIGQTLVSREEFRLVSAQLCAIAKLHASSFSKNVESEHREHLSQGIHANTVLTAEESGISAVSRISFDNPDSRITFIAAEETIYNLREAKTLTVVSRSKATPECGVQVQDKAEIQPEAETDTDVTAEVLVEPEPEAEVETYVEAKAEVKPDVEAKVEVDTIITTEAKPEPEVEVITTTEAKPEAETKTKAETESKAEVEDEDEVDDEDDDCGDWGADLIDQSSILIETTPEAEQEFCANTTSDAAPIITDFSRSNTLKWKPILEPTTKAPVGTYPQLPAGVIKQVPLARHEFSSLQHGLSDTIISARQSAKIMGTIEAGDELVPVILKLLDVYKQRLLNGEKLYMGELYRLEGALLAGRSIAARFGDAEEWSLELESDLLNGHPEAMLKVIDLWLKRTANHPDQIEELLNYEDEADDDVATYVDLPPF